MLLLQMLGGALLLLGSALVIGTVIAFDAPRPARRKRLATLPQRHVMPERRAA